LPPPWPEQELWSFEAQNELRVVRIEGAPGVSPDQTDVPTEWRTLPLYLLEPGKSLRVEEMKRGGTSAQEEQLALQREIRLALDGKGLTAKDTMTGTLYQSRRLHMRDNYHLGRVQINGIDQFITRLHEGEPPGVEIREGELHLVGESRHSEPFEQLSVTGW